MNLITLTKMSDGQERLDTNLKRLRFSKTVPQNKLSMVKKSTILFVSVTLMYVTVCSPLFMEKVDSLMMLPQAPGGGQHS